jgi:hypothetical protein
MGKIITFITDRLKERSTWLGLTGVLTAIGVGLEPSQLEAISVAGVAIAGLIATFTADKK